LGDLLKDVVVLVSGRIDRLSAGERRSEHRGTHGHDHQRGELCLDQVGVTQKRLLAWKRENGLNNDEAMPGR